MATVGDLFINFKVRKEGLDAGSQSLGRFVDKSKKQLNDLNQGFGGLQNTLSTVGIPTGAFDTARSMVNVLTKGIPSIIKGFSSMSAAATLFKGIIMGIGGPITLIVGALAAIGGMIYKAYSDAAETSKNMIEGYAKYAEERIKATMDALKGARADEESMSKQADKLRQGVQTKERLLAVPAAQRDAEARAIANSNTLADAAQRVRDAEYGVLQARANVKTTTADLVKYQLQLLNLQAAGVDEEDDRFIVAKQMADALEKTLADEKSILKVRQDTLKTAQEASTLTSRDIAATEALRKSEAEAARIADEKARKQQADAAFRQEMLSIEDEMIGRLEGQDALEDRIYRRRLEAMGLESGQVQAIMLRRDEARAAAKVDEARSKAEDDLKTLVEQRAELEEKIAQTVAEASAKALADDVKRQQFTESLDTAIGEFKIAGITDAVDIQKRIADETRAQTIELRKLNDKISSQEALLQ